MLKIHEEHTYLSGDGFNAWTTYPRCPKGGLTDEYVKGCFETKISNIRPGIQQPLKPLYKTLTTIPILENVPTTTEPIMLEETTTLKPFVSKKATAKPLNKPQLDNELKQQRKNFASNKSPILNQSGKNNAGIVTLKKRVNEQKNSRTSHTTTTLSHAARSPVTTTKKAPTTKKALRSKVKTPFDIFAFYLSDYTSKPSINYKPIQFDSKKSQIIINNKKPESSSRQSKGVISPRDRERSLSNFNFEPLKTSTTTQRSTTKTSFFINLPLNYYDNRLEQNRIGRENITPHSLDYLLKLTTPRTPFYG